MKISALRFIDLSYKGLKRFSFLLVVRVKHKETRTAENTHVYHQYVNKNLQLSIGAPR